MDSNSETIINGHQSEESAIDFAFKTKLTFSSDTSYVTEPRTRQDTHNRNICNL